MDDLRETFAGWYDDWADDIYTYLRLMIGPVLAEDAVQETFLRAWTAIDRFSGTHPRAWLFRIAHNVGVDYMRANRAPPGPCAGRAAGTERAGQPGPEADLVQRESIARIVYAVNSLRPTYRNVLVLSGVVGLSAREAASVLGWSLPQLYVIRHRARKMLAARLRALDVRTEGRQ